MRKILVGMLVVAAAGGVAAAKPTKAQLGQAKALYDAAEAEVRASKFTEAARDYTAAYELTKDAALLFKIASADQDSGACDAAVPYYQRYLKEASPTQKYVDLTNERIAKCAAAAASAAPAATVVSPTAVEAQPAPPAAPAPEVAPAPTAEPAPAPAPSPAPPPAADTKPVAVADEPTPGHERDRAWAMAGAAVFLGGAGIVLDAQGRSTESSGYKDAGYAVIGLGVVAAAASVYCFVRHDPHAAEQAMIVPTAQQHGGGVAAVFRF